MKETFLGLVPGLAPDSFRRIQEAKSRQELLKIFDSIIDHGSYVTLEVKTVFTKGGDDDDDKSGKPKDDDDRGKETRTHRRDRPPARRPWGRRSCDHVAHDPQRDDRSREGGHDHVGEKDALGNAKRDVIGHDEEPGPEGHVRPQECERHPAYRPSVPCGGPGPCETIDEPCAWHGPAPDAAAQQDKQRRDDCCGEPDGDCEPAYRGPRACGGRHGLRFRGGAGRRRVEEIVASCAAKSADCVVDSLFNAVAEHSAGVETFDDQTVVAIKVRDGGQAAPKKK